MESMMKWKCHILNLTGGFFLNMSDVSDLIEHKILQQKLPAYRIKGVMFERIKYKQKSLLNNDMRKDWEEMKSSNLFFDHFLLYINNLNVIEELARQGLVTWISNRRRYSKQPCV